jgi:hypothetical protein
MDFGILVITLDASIVTNTEAFSEAFGTSLYEGTVKFFGVQSSRKKPMVLAMAGSTGGLYVVVVSVGGLGGGVVSTSFFFLHPDNTITAIKQ